MNTSLFNSFIIWCANALLGWPRYRVKFIYKDKTGNILFNFTQTMSVRDAYYINQQRDMKKARGELYNISSIRPALCNGTLEAEPICFLGRWKNR